MELVVPQAGWPKVAGDWVAGSATNGPLCPATVNAWSSNPMPLPLLEGTGKFLRDQTSPLLGLAHLLTAFWA